MTQLVNDLKAARETRRAGMSERESERACETPMKDHVAAFWRNLKENHVRILVEMRRDHDDGVPHWDSSSSPDAVAKALIAERNSLLSQAQELVGAIKRFQRRLKEKQDQLLSYRKNDCQIDHARTIADARIAQIFLDLKFFDEECAAPLSAFRKTMEG